MKLLQGNINLATPKLFPLWNAVDADISWVPPSENPKATKVPLFTTASGRSEYASPTTKNFCRKLNTFLIGDIASFFLSHFAVLDPFLSLIRSSPVFTSAGWTVSVFESHHLPALFSKQYLLARKAPFHNKSIFIVAIVSVSSSSSCWMSFQTFFFKPVFIVAEPEERCHCESEKPYDLFFGSLPFSFLSTIPSPEISPPPPPNNNNTLFLIAFHSTILSLVAILNLLWPFLVYPFLSSQNRKATVCSNHKSQFTRSSTFVLFVF